MKLTGITYFSQKDPQWKSLKLGTSTVSTINDYGCLLCDVASVLTYYGKDTNPARLNDDLKRVKGFVNGSLLVYGAVTDIYPDVTVDWDNFIDCSTIPAPLDKIDALLGARKPVIVKVDYSPSTTKLDEHWVTIIGKTEDGAYIIMDPIDGSEQFFHARYGDPKRYIFKIVAYNGLPKNNTTDKDKIVELEDKVKTLNERVAEVSFENNNLREALKKEEDESEQAIRDLNRTREEKATLSWEKEQLEIKVKTYAEEIEKLKDSIQSQKEQLTQLRIDLAASYAKKINEYSLWEILYYKVLKRGEK